MRKLLSDSQSVILRNLNLRCSQNLVESVKYMVRIKSVNHLIFLPFVFRNLANVYLDLCEHVTISYAAKTKFCIRTQRVEPSFQKESWA